MEEEVIKFDIRNKQDRDNMISILAHNGYHVWVESTVYGIVDIWNICVAKKPEQDELLMA